MLVRNGQPKSCLCSSRGGEGSPSPWSRLHSPQRRGSRLRPSFFLLGQVGFRVCQAHCKVRGHVWPLFRVQQHDGRVLALFSHSLLSTGNRGPVGHGATFDSPAGPAAEPLGSLERGRAAPLRNAKPAARESWPSWVQEAATQKRPSPPSRGWRIGDGGWLAEPATRSGAASAQDRDRPSLPALGTRRGASTGAWGGSPVEGGTAAGTKVLRELGIRWRPAD